MHMHSKQQCIKQVRNWKAIGDEVRHMRFAAEWHPVRCYISVLSCNL